MEQLKKWIWNKKQTTTDTGRITEDFASEYLILQNLTLLDQNFHSKYGEIDLIMLDNSMYVFVEVKYRKNAQFGGSLVAVSPSKQQKLRLCAKYYLQQKQLNEYNTPCRFDIVALEGDIKKPNINWLKNAF
ncbi:YraN family protein [Colwellia sp. UCD-KL20]|uniref:YraN family protein n=1 Tax=Colwellia sp. UCD-KL20 TaxID=1917165 RepID=UPI0009713F9B|nr:YraN family protein [Colwellia sp. UCD-KL20]